MSSTTSPRASTGKRRRYAARLPVEERREQLLDAALRIVARDGYDAVSIDAIAREAGVTRPVVYAAYDGLGPLLHALLDRSQLRALSSVLGLLPDDADLSDPDAFLLTATRGLVDAVQSDPDIWKPILGLTQGAPAAVRERIESDREAIRRRMAEMLAEGLEARGGPDLDAEVLSHMLLAALEHFGRLILEDPPRFTTERMIDALGGLLRAVEPAR